MITKNKAVLWFHEVGSEDLGMVGGKGANLGVMSRASFPVPPGFIVSSDAFFSFLQSGALVESMRELIGSLVHSDSDSLDLVSSSIKKLISTTEVPKDLEQAIIESYRQLGGGLVAVRSSATAEDLPDASFAGQQNTFLNVEGEADLINAIRDCWASLYEGRAIFYREDQGFGHLEAGIAVVVQRMVQPDAAGVAFTVEPLTGESDKVLIEAIFGLGEPLVSGEMSPDMYTVEKNSKRIIEKRVTKQDWKLVRGPGEQPNVGESDTNHQEQVAHEDSIKQKLEDSEIINLADMAMRIEQVYGSPQDIEWAKEGGRFYLLQARPVTTCYVG